MTSKSSSSAAGGGIDKMASVKRIAVIAAVVLLLSMAVVGAASAITVTITTTPYDDQSGHGVTYAATVGGTAVAMASSGYESTFTAEAGKQVIIAANCTNSIVRPQDWNISGVDYSAYTKGYNTVSFVMPAGDVNVGVTEGKLLPSGYKELEYIESSGTQYIDTGLASPGWSLSFSVKFQTDNTSGSAPGYGNIFGARVTGEYMEYQLSLYNSSFIDVGGGRNINMGFNTADIHEITYADRYATIDGVKKSVTTGSISTNYNIYLFGINENNKACQLESVKIYYVKFGEERYFVPCVTSDGDVGMYDILHDTFYRNKGTGSFTGVYKVMYDENGGSGTVPAGQEITIGSFASISDGSELTGPDSKKFAGWNTVQNPTQENPGILYAPGQSIINTGNMTLYAQWTESPVFMVGYNANGATGGTTPLNQNTYSEFDIVTVEGGGTLEKSGYNFVGWTCDKDLTTTSGIITAGNLIPVGTVFTMPADNVVLSAKWTPITYTVRYNANGGSGSMEDQGFTYDVAQNLSANTFTKKGYAFAGWTTSAQGDVVYSDKQEVCNLTTTQGDTLNLYAKWTPITYTVRYNANGGVGSMEDQEFTYDVARNLSTNVFTKTGCVFPGWATDEHGSVVYSDEQSVINLTATQGDTVNLYAVWDTITYTFVIPAALSLDGSGSATTADYSITMTSTQVSGDLRRINMNLTGSVNYDTENDAFRVKNLYSENYQDYTIKSSDNTSVALDDTIVSVRVNGTDGTSKTETLSYRLTGSTVYAGTYQDTLTFEVSIVSIIPAEYTVVEYIKSNSSGSYIDTGIYVDLSKDFTLSGETGFMKNGRGMLFSCFESNPEYDGLSIEVYDCKRFRIYIDSTDLKIDSVNVDLNELFEFSAEYHSSDGKFYTDINGVSGVSSAVRESWRTVMEKSSILGGDYRHYYDYGLYGEIKVYNPGLIADYIPCVRKSDNVAGMYDIVNNEFKSSGSNPFIAGPVV